MLCFFLFFDVSRRRFERDSGEWRFVVLHKLGLLLLHGLELYYQKKLREGVEIHRLGHVCLSMEF